MMIIGGGKNPPILVKRERKERTDLYKKREWGKDKLESQERPRLRFSRFRSNNNTLWVKKKKKRKKRAMEKLSPGGSPVMANTGVRGFLLEKGTLGDENNWGGNSHLIQVARGMQKMLNQV